MEQSPYIFSFGEAVCVRQALAQYYKPAAQPVDLLSMGYPNKHGLEELQDRTKVWIAKTLGISYKHILITSGAAQALNISMRAFFATCAGMIYFESPHFRFYPEMAGKNGMVGVRGDSLDAFKGFLQIIDSPSNPEGLIRIQPKEQAGVIVWDAAYHNPVYCKVLTYGPKHHVMIGSFGKLLGINGIRLGWIAVESDSHYEVLRDELYAETLGVSVQSQNLALDILKTVNMEAFTRTARGMVDDNRGEFLKLEYMSGSQVSTNGMFFWMQTDPKALALFDKVGVQYIKGSECGATDEFARFNLAQDRALTQNMIRAVLKEDGK